LPRAGALSGAQGPCPRHHASAENSKAVYDRAPRILLTDGDFVRGIIPLFFINSVL
jgi:hypothetical protein